MATATRDWLIPTARCKTHTRRSKPAVLKRLGEGIIRCCGSTIARRLSRGSGSSLDHRRNRASARTLQASISRKRRSRRAARRTRSGPTGRSVRASRSGDGARASRSSAAAQARLLRSMTSGSLLLLCIQVSGELRRESEREEERCAPAAEEVESADFERLLDRRRRRDHNFRHRPVARGLFDGTFERIRREQRLVDSCRRDLLRRLLRRESRFAHI